MISYIERMLVVSDEGFLTAADSHWHLKTRLLTQSLHELLVSRMDVVQLLSASDLDDALDDFGRQVWSEDYLHDRGFNNFQASVAF